MSRARPDHRAAILEKLALHGPLRFSQLAVYLQITNRGELDYDLRCLRKSGDVRSGPGMLWTLSQ